MAVNIGAGWSNKLKHMPIFGQKSLLGLVKQGAGTFLYRDQ